MIAQIVRNILAICFLLLPISAGANSIPRHLYFQNVIENKDVSIGEVLAIEQDHEGFLWFGGRNGVIRYDGYHFLNIQVKQEQSAGAQKKLVTWVYDFLEDSRKDLWIASHSGLYKYNRDLELLEHIHPEVINFNSGYCIEESPTGEILIGTHGGLYIVDPHQYDVTLVGRDRSNPKSLPYNVIYAMKKDKQGKIWFGLHNGLSILDWDTREFTFYKPYSVDPDSVDENAIRTLDVDQKGNVWLGTHAGVKQFVTKTQQFKSYKHDPQIQNSLGGNQIWDIYVDSLNRIWVGTDKGGLNLFNPHDDSFIRFKNNNAPGDLSSSAIKRIYEDQSGDLWVGSYPQGIDFHDQSTQAYRVYRHNSSDQNSIMTDYVAAVVQDKQGNIWLGNGGGVDFLDEKTGRFKHYRHTAGEDSKIKSSSIISGYIDSDNEIWFGTWEHGVHRFNREADSFDQIDFQSGAAKTKGIVAEKLLADTVWSFLEDSEKNIWIGTHASGPVKYDKVKRSFTHYPNVPSDIHSISNSLIWSMMEDSKKRLWFGTAYGLNLMDRDKETFTRYNRNVNDPGSLVHDSVLSMIEDSRGRLWFGGDGGLHLFNEENHSFTHYGTHTGFVDQVIRSIVEDKLGFLWMSTNKGVVRFNPETEEVRNFKRFNGELLGGFNTGAGLLGVNGEVMFGGVKGLRIFDINRFVKNERPPPVVLTNFSIFTKDVPVGEGEGELNRVINQTRKVVLDYTESMFSIEFAALNFREPEKNSYAYKLEGFDKEWREIGDRRRAQYTNLSAGRYHFRVRASNNDAVWHERDKKLEVIQLPAPWRTWWAYSLYALFIVVLILQYIYKQKRKQYFIEEQNRILERKVMERTSDLRKKNNDIQSMLGSMQQGLFAIDANGEIQPDYSKHLEEIFESNDFVGRDAIALLFSDSDLGQDVLVQIEQTVGVIVGADLINFEFNERLLVRDCVACVKGKNKYLSLDWSPVVDEGIVSSLMVSVRNVTELKQMEAEAAHKNQELNMIGQLVNLTGDSFTQFVKSSRLCLEGCRDILQSEGRVSSQTQISLQQEEVNTLFRNMHTLKGNSRIFSFNYITELAHEAESKYAEVRENNNGFCLEELLHDVVKIESVIDEYVRIYEEVLGRDVQGGLAGEPNGAWLSGENVHTITDCVQKLKKSLKEDRYAELLDPILSVFKTNNAKPLSEVLASVIESIPQLATSLGKSPPNIRVSGDDCEVKNEHHNLIVNVFTHLLRNSVDHGIELPEVRAKRGKEEKGEICLELSSEESWVVIDVYDDGQGLGLKRLYHKGLDNGIWNKDEKPSLKEIAEVIFHSGLSTRDEVTEVSGRGVGMDAVKQFVVESGGQITIVLEAEDDRPCAEDIPEFKKMKIRLMLPVQHFNFM